MKLHLSFLTFVASAGLLAHAAPSAQDRQASEVDKIAERSFISILATEILDLIESTAECAGCDAILVALKGIADLGDTIFVDVITEVCTLSKSEDSDVCAGSVGAEGPILAYDLRELTVGSHTSQLFCTNFFGLCPYPSVTPHTISFPQPKPNKPRPPPSGKTPLKVVHISDTHVDLSYETGASYNCTKPICCRPYTAADSPGNNDFPAGPYGETTCDPPLSLEESMFAAIESLVPDAAFTIFTGDVVAHDVWLVTENEVQTDLNATYSQMRNLKLVYPALGNHDTAPVNAFPPTAIQNPSNTAQWAYNTMSSDWSTWIGTAASQSVQEYGAYSVLYPGGNLRIISFNSIFYYTDNFWLYSDPMETDPSGQFAWLVQELQLAETAGQNVWLISHVPSGSGDYFRDYSNTFNQIIERYEATIAGLFYGHTHVDQFEIAYTDYTNPSFSNAFAMSYITPSMTPTSGSPSFRVYSVDPETFGILDFTEYIADITLPSYQTGPTWTKYYSAKAAYGPLVSPPLTDPAAELTPAFWHNVTQAFESNDAAFQAYYARRSRGFDVTTCSGTCKTNEICGMRSAEAQYNCATVSPGVHFTKRDGKDGHGDECEGSKTRAIFQAIAGRRVIGPTAAKRA